MVDIMKPIPAWILAKLYDDDVPTPKRQLLRKLCSQSFTTMTEDTAFDNAINDLTEAKLIEYVEQKYTDHVPLVDDDDSGMPYRRMAPVEKERSGFLITDLGIIAFRRQFGSSVERIVKSIDYNSIMDDKKLSQIYWKLKGSGDVMAPIVKACIDNAPEVLEFINNMTARLGIPRA